MYILKDRVGASRTGETGLMRFSDAIEVIQDCSMFWLESEPSFQNFLKANNLGMILLSRQADILRLPAYGEKITVRTSIFGCDKFSGYRNTVLYGENDRPCVATWCIGVFVNLKTGKMSKVPEEELDKITIDRKIDMDYLPKHIVVPDSPGQRLDSFTVRRGDIDMYHHMNNAKYVRAALEFLPKDFTMHRMRIEYKRSAKAGYTLYPERIQTPSGKCYILLENAKKRPYAVLEFS
ncbi:acyl-[acyl-carrier-protein] thioesterase [Sporolactobacillus vineae]|uniref:acyl-[acyl-carrier-protein] thioesterase n=1 Tax=Sporolactobacillus vineae TaxID=444463 RepID=UPI00028A3B36|nr:acyl-ACP thioesterase domain-containing protein [Sporolactobacillus vineae]